MTEVPPDEKVSAGERSPVPRGELGIYLALRGASLTAAHMFNVALGWQIYEITGSALMLGIAGLIRFLPAILLFPVTGYLVDRYPRLTVLGTSLSVQLLVIATYFGNSLSSDPGIGVVLALLLPFGVSRAFTNTAMRSIIPSIVERHRIAVSVAYSSTVARVATLAGPILGGLSLGLWGGGTYLVIGVFYIIAFLLVCLMRPIQSAGTGDGRLRTSLLGGVKFLRGNGILSSAILLDFMASVWGTVIGLLPVIAKDVLEAGPEVLGVLRAAPALGAILAAGVLSQMPSPGRTGPLLLYTLGLHGLSIVAFGLSTSIILCVAILALYGATDMIGVVVRQSLVQLSTPNKVLGRVAAIESATSNGSEELGSFRAGLMAAAIGPQAAIIAGGGMVLALAVSWATFSPKLRRLGRLEL